MTFGRTAIGRFGLAHFGLTPVVGIVETPIVLFTLRLSELTCYAYRGIGSQISLLLGQVGSRGC
jgi:hypothetical protein